MVTRIWFGRYISPVKYVERVDKLKSFITSPSSWFSAKRNRTFSYNIKTLLKPERIIVNHSANRKEFTASDVDFEAVASLYKDFMENVLLGEAKITEKALSAESEYFAALKGKSVFVSYGNKTDARLVSMSLSNSSENKITSDNSEIKDILIAFNDNVLNNVYVYIADGKTGNVTKYSVEYNKAKFDNLINDIFAESIGGNIPSYSFELNFHKSAEGSMAKVLFSPTILLDVTPKKTQGIGRKNVEVFAENGEIPSDTENAVLRAFKINPLTMRKMLDSSGMVFVENYGTLSVSPAGVVEFKAVDGSGGIALFENEPESSYNIYNTTTLAVDFISDVCMAFSDSMLDNLKINCELTSSQGKSGRYEFKFDYFIDGAPVLISSDGEMKSAIEMVIENGQLMSYRHYLRQYFKTEDVFEGMTSISAADKIVENTPENELPIYINRLGTCYIDDEDEVLRRAWKIDIEGKNGAVFVE